MTTFPPMMVPVSADDAAMRRVLAQAEARVDQFAGRVDGSLRRVEGAFDRAGTMAGRLGGAVAGIGLAHTAAEALRAADAWNLATSKIALYAGSAERAVEVQEQLFQVAQRTRSALEPTVGLYSSLADSVLAMGKRQSDVVRLTETVSKTFKISGTEAGAASGALTQLAQAMSAGVLRGDEFNSVMEASPRLAKALADGLGVPRAALRALAEQGQLTADKVVGALLKQGAAIDAEFGRIATTVGDSLTVLGNASQRQIAQFDKAVGATATLSSGILSLANNLETAATAAVAAALAVGAIAAARTAPTAITAVTRAIDDQRTALYAKAVATAEAAAAEKAAAAQDLLRAQTARAAAAATVQAAEAEFAVKAAAASSASATLATAETSLTAARGKTLLTTNVYALNRALAAERAAEAAVVTAREASVVADTEKTASLTRLRAAQLASAAAGEAVAAADTHLTTMAVSAQAATTALAQRASVLSVAWGGLRAAGSGLLALVGGPVGAALLAGAAAVTFFATRTTAAEDATSSFEVAQRAAQDAVKESATDVEALAKQYDGLSDSMRAVTRVKLADALAEQAKAIAAQRAAASAAVFGASSPARPVSGNWNVATDTASAPRMYERMGLAAAQVDRLRTAFAAFRSAAADDPEAIAALVRVLDEVGRSAGDAGKPLVELASKLADPATRAQAASRASQELAARLALLNNPADAAAKAVLAAGRTADDAASRFAGLGSAVGTVATKLAELGGKTWTLSLPEGMERRVGEMVGPPPEQKTPVVTGLQDRGKSPDDTAYQSWDATRDVVRGRLKTQVVPAEGAETVRLLTLEADAQEKLSKARASGQPWAIKEAEVNAEVAKRLREGLDPAKQTEVRTQLLRKARAEFSGDVGAQVTQLNLDVAAQQRLTAAAGKGEAAQRSAAAANRVAAAALKGYGDAAGAAEARVEALTVEQIRKDSDQPILDRIRAQKDLIAAYEEGPKAVKATEIAEQAHTLALKEGEEGTQKYADAKAHYIALLTQASQLEASAAAGPMLQRQRDQLELGQQQLALMGASAERRAVELARTQALIDLREKNIDAASREGQAYLANAESLAKQNLAIDRANSAYQELEQFGDRSFDAILQKLSAAGKATMSWADAIGTVRVELQQLALKMAVINPVKNFVLGTNLPTIFDLGGSGRGGGSGQSGQGGGMGSLGNLFSLGSKFIPSSWTDGITSGITSTIDKFGLSTLGIGQPATTSYGTLVGGGSMLEPGKVSVASGTGLSAYLGSFGIGSAVGGLLGPLLANGNKAVGGLVGAGSGALAGAAAGTWLFPGVGTLVGALLGGAGGGLGGLLGTQKPTVGPNSAGNIVLNGKGGFRTDKALADNDGDPNAMQQVTDAVATAMSTLVSGLGAKLTGSDGANTGLLQFFAKDNKWYVTPQTGAQAGQRSEFTDQDQALQFYMRSALQGLLSSGQLTGLNADAQKALGTSKATKAEDLASDLELATGFRDQLELMKASLDPTNNLIKTFTENSKKVGEQVKANITDWATKAKELGLATEEELNPALKKGLLAMMGLGPWTEPLRGLASVTKQATIGFEAFRPALVSLGYTAEDQAHLLSEYVAKAEKTYTDSVSRLQRGGSATLDALTDPFAKAPVLDRLVDSGLDPRDGYVTDLATVIDNVERTAHTGTLAMTDLRWAMGQVNAQLMAGVLTAEQYQTVVGMLTQAWTDNTAAAQQVTERKQGMEDLTVRSLRAQGLATKADDYERGLQQQREIADATARGYDAAYIAGLRYVHNLDNVAAANRHAAEVAEFSGDLLARTYTAMGDTATASQISLALRQAHDLTAAQAAGYDTSLLVQVQAQERAQQRFDSLHQDLLAAYDKEIAAKQEAVSAIQSGAIAMLQVARQFQNARASIREGDESPLAPDQKIREATGRFDAAYAKLHDVAATDQEKDVARQTLLQMGATLVSMEKAASGGTASVLFNKVDSVFTELGDTTALGLDTAERDLQVAQDELKELQRQRTQAAALGERQIASIESLQRAVTSALATYNGTVSTLAQGQSSSYANWMSGWFARYNGLLAGTANGSVTADSAQSQGTALWQEKVNQANALPLVESVWRAVIGAAQAAPNGAQTAEWFSQLAHDRGVPGFATGGISYGPQLAWVSEGAYTAEAHVPLPDGRRIPVALQMPRASVDPVAPMVSMRRPSLDTDGAGVGELVAAVRELRAELRTIGRDALIQRARIASDAAGLLQKVEAASLDLPKKLANTRRAA